MDGRQRYRIIPRQSELAVRIVGESQSELFANAGFALFDLMTELDKVEVKERVQLEVDGADLDDLMVNWTRELLYLYQGSGYLLREFLVREASETRVRAEVCGEKIDPDRHEIKREIVGVALHQSRLQKTGNQWTAQLVFEI
ncbi:MAG TPA: archease [candidate division Zixibacteria bacterium]|nr:archease [candidate division Zixibacteria bacterium]